ncbi:hypothetical protein B296_00031482 [Ensete ventricosum]|uniref:Uncharacterized protein n=1 Tax=Ensete ventricosum TaxID=4639 RepID=A0A426ZLY7_ENSVE|nr:hypothetical protein B296_00031482 [Ensete ventricosum]
MANPHQTLTRSGTKPSHAPAPIAPRFSKNTEDQARSCSHVMDPPLPDIKDSPEPAQRSHLRAFPNALPANPTIATPRPARSPHPWKASSSPRLQERRETKSGDCTSEAENKEAKRTRSKGFGERRKRRK